MRSISKWLYRWFRRVHDVLAIVLCCLWVAGWFMFVEFHVPQSNRLSSQSIDVLADADEVILSWRVAGDGYDAEFSSMGVIGFRRVLKNNALIVPKLIRGEKLIWSVEETFGNLGHFPAANGFPTIFLVFPFLIWPLGRLTHRIAKRKSAAA